MQQDKRTVVIDNGTGLCKVGLAGDDAPKSCFPSLVGKPKFQDVMLGVDTKEIFVGDEANSKKGILNLDYPIKNGVVKNWEDMEQIWQHAFTKELQLDSSQCSVLISEAPNNPKPNREKTIQLMFEAFNVTSFATSVSGVLALYASARTTGLAVECGDGNTHTVPIYEGYFLNTSIQKIDLAGKSITQYLAQLLTQLDVTLASPTELEIVRDIKEKLCYVAGDYDEEVKNSKESSPYDLPDGNSVYLQTQRFKAPELLFKPNLFKLQVPSIQELVFQSIQKCDMNLRQELYHNIILSGGSTLFSGLTERLGKELLSLAPKAMKVKIIAADERKFATWIGGSILASMESFQNKWVTKSEYDEHGATIVHKKFP